jgi:serine/threonine-protein kinase
LLTGLSPGSRVAGYLLEKLVGVGGMAAVFRARDERLGRVVALKLLAGDEAARKRFVREARAVAGVDHPHIIPVYEAGEAGGVMFIAMRFVAGADLQVMVDREGGLRPKRAAMFISPVASALDAAHDAGLVHRDVKPANMLVDIGPGRPEHVYLSDFGVARSIVSAGGLTAAGQFFGTPDYAAPEQMAGRPVDGRLDQYSLACVTYTLLSGTAPFKRDEPVAVLYAHLYKPPPRLTAVRPDLPRAVDQVLARGLAKAPEDRYDSCGTFADALREALDLEPYDPAGAVRPSATGRSAAAAAPAGRSIGPQPSSTKPLTPPDGSPAVPARPTAAQSAALQPTALQPTALQPTTLQPTTLQPVAPHLTASEAAASEAAASEPPTAVTTWTAVVSADRAYYDSVRAVNEKDTASLTFPGSIPERRYPLSGTEVRIGRRSVSRRIEPEIDLTGPPTDPGVSRLHAVLRAGPDRGWSVVDTDSPNGIQVNGKDIPPGEAVPLRDGDRIHLGAWTVITITRG